MAHKFKEDDIVYHKGEGYQNIAGLYRVEKVSKDGTIYRVVDIENKYTDADEDELEALAYAVFVNIEHGWPIIIPVYNKALYEEFLKPEKGYRRECRGNILTAIEAQTNILKGLGER